MKKIRLILISLMIAAVSILVPQTSASADHINENHGNTSSSHWGHGFVPWISADCSTSICTYTANAENDWKGSFGQYPNGFNTGNPYYYCDTYSGGWIKTCWQTASFVHSLPGCSTMSVCTQVLLTNNEPTVHINSVLNSLCNTCGTQPGGAYLPQHIENLLEHAYGHSLGLGDSTASAFTPMKTSLPDNQLYLPAQHDKDTIEAMYATLTPAEQLHGGEATHSLGDLFVLIFQATDGNLVLYQTGGSALWSSNTGNRGAAWAEMQTDGNFVVRTVTTALCSTHTQNHPGAFLKVQTDNNLVIYASNGTTVLWAKSLGGVCN